MTTIVDVRTGTVRRLPEVDGIPVLDPGRHSRVKLEPTVTDAMVFCDIIDELINFLLDLKHSFTCRCSDCDRRDRLIALLLEPMQ